ncbi:hypothetical protein BJX68DRAFT_257617 [Aspergillus pseudodeflectus]|uniref:Uncharacterized protein n=1 Tax=Aspergillus pseudodeflectus TaxID=176178 RepID=A0ABR4JSM0_9EURO
MAGPNQPHRGTSLWMNTCASMNRPAVSSGGGPGRGALRRQLVKHPCWFPHPSIWPLPNDTLHFPTLAAKSLDLQTREMFNASLCNVLIPETYAAFSKRLDQDIVAFVRDDQRAQCPPIQWAVRCYASWHLATLHSDADLLAQSRYIYGILIRYLQSALGDPRRSTSQTTLTVALLMGIYEVFDGSSPDAWLVHIRGAKEILKRRGAAAHSSGFARTIVFSCRAFFIVEALISCEECFLAEQEWASVNASAFEREDRQGRGCRLVTLMDRTYREVVRVPGLVARTKAVLGTDINKGRGGLMADGQVGDDEGAATASREELRIQIQRSRTTLRRLGRGLSSLSPEETTPKDQHGEYIVDSRFVSPIIRHNLYAASAVEESLGRLSAMLADSKEPDPTFNEPRLVEIPSQSQTLTSDIMSPSLASSGSTSLDFLFLSLGVMAL